MGTQSTADEPEASPQVDAVAACHKPSATCPTPGLSADRRSQALRDRRMPIQRCSRRSELASIYSAYVRRKGPGGSRFLYDRPQPAMAICGEHTERKLLQDDHPDLGARPESLVVPDFVPRPGLD